MTLNNGEVFPSLVFQRAGGGEIRLPDDLAGGFGVILFNRGSWCRYCSTQLTAFSRAAERFAAEDIKVVSVSVDERQKAEALVADLKLAFPVGYGADGPAVSEATGAFVNNDPAYLQATGFVVDPEGRIVTAVYSTGAIGRLLPDDVLGLVRYAKASADR